MVGVFGGSLGARRINEAACDLVDEWRDRSDRAVYHVVGRRDWPAGGDPTPTAGVPIVRRVPYEEHMELLYAAVDVMVCRAGAMTVAELAVTGCPAVLVPLPGAPGDHQTANARVLEQAGGARVLADTDCNGATLRRLLDELLVDGARLAAMGRAAVPSGVGMRPRPAPGLSKPMPVPHPGVPTASCPMAADRWSADPCPSTACPRGGDWRGRHVGHRHRARHHGPSIERQ